MIIMDSNEKEMLVQNGFDVDGAMHRFLNNEALYKKCMRKYLDDTSFDDLIAAVNEGNCNEAFKAAGQLSTQKHKQTMSFLGFYHGIAVIR